MEQRKGACQPCHHRGLALASPPPLPAGMVSMWYAMREALALVAEEGLEAMWVRHEAVHQQLWEGLSAMGLQPFVEDPKDRLVTVNTIKVRRRRWREAVRWRCGGSHAPAVARAAGACSQEAWGGAARVSTGALPAHAACRASCAAVGCRRCPRAWTGPS